MLHKFPQLFDQAYQPPDRRTQQEQMNDLLDEISSEVEMDSRLPDPVTEIAARLNNLKQPYRKEEPAGDKKGGTYYKGIILKSRMWT